MTFRNRVGVSFVFSMVAIVVSASAAAAQCRGASTAYVPMSAVIGQGGYLSSDGNGAYVDGTQGAAVTLHNGANLAIVEVKKNPRALTFNLNSPNPIPDAVYAQPLGVTQDRQGEVHVLYKLDPEGTDGLRQMHTLEELPDDGVFYASARTDLFVEINGVRHLLMFGGDAWPLNACQISVGAVFDAPGTTKLQIARMPGGETYVLQAPPGSIARLFDYSNTFSPVDRGLYRFSFTVTFSPKPKKGK